MSLAEQLASIDFYQDRIRGSGTLTPEMKRRLDHRFRLDWNYHSNVMEGNSLTKQETRTIMLGNVTVDGKPLRDVLEMRGHDQVITALLQMSRGELQLSERRIKDVHAAIMQEEDPAKQGWKGQWKSVPNYLYNYRNERFDFTAPEEVPEAMHRLIDRTNSAIDKVEKGGHRTEHPTLIAFDFHREFVSIHPFHDGNGRSARIFSNLILIRLGYPPLIIRVDEKDEYNKLLAETQAYGAAPDLFYAFLAERLVRSLELVLDATMGRSLEEPEDLDKRLALLDKELEAADPTERTHRLFNTETFNLIKKEWLVDLLASLPTVAKKFDRYFMSSSISLTRNNRTLGSGQDVRSIADRLTFNTGWNDDRTLPMEIRLLVSYKSFRAVGQGRLDCECGVTVRFEQLTYSILVEEDIGVFATSRQAFHRMHHQPLTEMERRVVGDLLGRAILEQLERWARPSDETAPF